MAIHNETRTWSTFPIKVAIILLILISSLSSCSHSCSMDMNVVDSVLLPFMSLVTTRTVGQ
jgi:hypothetical protein